jgi:hypothetical protein
MSMDVHFREIEPYYMQNIIFPFDDSVDQDNIWLAEEYGDNQPEHDATSTSWDHILVILSSVRLVPPIVKPIPLSVGPVPPNVGHIHPSRGLIPSSVGSLPPSTSPVPPSEDPKSFVLARMDLQNSQFDLNSMIQAQILRYERWEFETQVQEESSSRERKDDDEPKYMIASTTLSLRYYLSTFHTHSTEEYLPSECGSPTK